MTARPAPREQGWIPVILALAAFLLLPSAPPFSALLPIDFTLGLLTAALAACFVVGWWKGGRLSLAVAWVALAAWATLLPLRAAGPAGQAGGYHDLTGAWALLLSAIFGVVSIVSPRERFFPRALATVGLAMGLALLLVARRTSPGALQTAVAEQLAQRMDRAEQNQRRDLGSARAQAVLDRAPGVRAMWANWMRLTRAVAASVGAAVYPSLLALESLAALALAWSLYHRLNRARLGPPLTPLREFRFSGQLIWGLGVGLALAFVPSLAAFRVVGANLLAFFGVLYALRGIGVTLWLLPRGNAAMTAAAMAVAVLMTLVTFGGAAVGVGIFDTWINWRDRPRPTSYNS